MKKSDVIRAVLDGQYLVLPKNQTAIASAPTNIALVKYWGKRDQEINLPVTSSLSISLPNKGAQTEISVNTSQQDFIFLNKQAIDPVSTFAVRLVKFLDLFRDQDSVFFTLQIHSNIPIAAGLASSACGFAALVKALDSLYGWNLSKTQLSILSRLGSGSASRSLWNGFVEWQAGVQADGMDSYASPIETSWPELCVGLLIMQDKEKLISSREAMQRTVSTSLLYPQWSKKVDQDLDSVKRAIQYHDFDLLGKAAESNAMTMHALMLSAWPPVSYALPETTVAMQKIWRLRKEGLALYFTQDAGPNLKLLFLKRESQEVCKQFPDIEVIEPFNVI